MDLSTAVVHAGAWRLFRYEQVRSNGPDEEDVTARVFARSLPSIPPGTPYLLSPSFEYDLELNTFFHSADMLGSSMSTRVGYAGDLVAFFNFLHTNRGAKGWRDATANDHEAYFAWRREDPAGARVAASTWDRELAAANRFFTWQVRERNLPETPIAQRQRRMHRQRPGRNRTADTTPATRSHGSGRARVEWLPSASYRRWRDVGLRGYRVDGRRNSAFRGRWATRNGTFADMLIRTGLRLSEHASLFASEVPDLVQLDGFHRFYLPGAIAKRGSERWVYVPSTVLRAVHEYINTDRLEVVDRARSAGRYRLRPNSFILEPDGRHARLAGSSERVRVSLLTPAERRRTFVESAGGVTPASLWLSEAGDPMSVSTWKHIFGQANVRCGQHGVDLAASAHTLRHSFAVITLEHLQRGHIAALQSATPEQRGYYVRMFGDPLDWVRRLLGHRSVETTQIYLHALAELEMRTRMTLIPEEWEDSRDPDLLAPDVS
ncbi:site-specific integrase [Microbacterium sp. PAMC22086]|uniref:tyrosine-type recombinase/integrase n=1 Tax=Microbacterium sp. PAMC22086 TaxID=2861281 RepID=UPI001C6364B7|nr:site-specific integrase [Microbacterium sp. PAMC22086]QYG10876.1 tyrosine-type recombinase/integrase [Microbacterium sp. PAMC22086]